MNDYYKDYSMLNPGFGMWHIGSILYTGVYIFKTYHKYKLLIQQIFQDNCT